MTRIEFFSDVAQYLGILCLGASCLCLLWQASVVDAPEQRVELRRWAQSFLSSACAFAAAMLVLQALQR